MTHGAAQQVALLEQAGFLLGHLHRQSEALADQVGDHLDKLRTFFEQPVFRVFGLDGQHPLEITADLDGDGDEGQFALINLAAVEETCLVGDPCQFDGARFFQYQADDAFPRPVL